MSNKTKKKRRTFMRYMAETFINKLFAIAMLIMTIPFIYLENDATALVFTSMFAIPLFFAKENWIM